MNRASPFADDPVSANQENTRELRENRRRRSRFILPAPRHLAAVAVGALLAAVLVHYLGFMCTSHPRFRRTGSRCLRKSC